MKGGEGIGTEPRKSLYEIIDKDIRLIIHARSAEEAYSSVRGQLMPNVVTQRVPSTWLCVLLIVCTYVMLSIPSP